MCLCITFVPTVKHNKLESKDFEEAVKKILAEKGESDLDTLVRNFIQSEYPLNITEAIEIVHFLLAIKIFCDIFRLVEEQNDTLLKFVNDQLHEAETIRRQISEVGIFCAEEGKHVLSRLISFFHYVLD